MDSSVMHTSRLHYSGGFPYHRILCTSIHALIFTGRMPIIPPEIYLEILAHIESHTPFAEAKRYLLVISRVSRWFRSIVFPRVFRSLDCAWPDGGASRFPPALAFCAELNATASSGRSTALRLAESVRNCFFGPDTVAGRAATPSAVYRRIYTRALKYMPHISTVHLFRIFIDEKFLQALRALGKLETLRIHDCYWGNAISTTVAPKRVNFPCLSELDIMRENSDSGHVGVLMKPFLPILPKLLKFRTDDEAVVLTIATHIPSLTTLGIPRIDPSIVRMILAGSPSVTELSISQTLEPESMSALALPPYALPYLESLSCGPSDLVELLPGRNVKRVEVILDRESGCSEQLTAALGSPALEELTVPVFVTVPRTTLDRLKVLTLRMLPPLDSNVSPHHLSVSRGVP
jgi:hypothetical protein